MIHIYKFNRLEYPVSALQYLRFSIDMRCGNHLWEINQNWLGCIGDHNVEFVEITVDDSRIAQSNNQIHQVIIKPFHVVHFIYLCSANRANERNILDFEDPLISIEANRVMLYSVYPWTSSMTTQCLLKSIGFGTGKPRSYNAFM